MPAATKPAKSSFPRALRAVRKARGLAQEQFDQISSRTYISTLERGLKDPTLGKVDALASVMAVHPLTLLALAYCAKPTAAEIERLFARVAAEAEGLELRELGWRD